MKYVHISHTWPRAWMVLLCGFARPAYAHVWEPPLAHSSDLGVAVASGCKVICWQPAPTRIPIPNAYVLLREWCTPGFTLCVEDSGQDCPFDAGWSRLTAASEDDRDWVAPSADGFLVFDVFLPAFPFYSLSGAWAGPADWNLDGVVDSGDFFAFAGDFMGQEADFNLDGVTDWRDFLEYVVWFLLS